ncbi:MAG: energy transducer TonB [Rhodocyclales bacterium]|nr:energy transducer TonB [Rhodocyclales bacterium]
MWRGEQAASDERRLLALLVVSVGLHACVLAWVKAPVRPAAGVQAMLATLTASLRFTPGEAAPDQRAGRQQLAPPPRPEARQTPARREPQRLPAVLETAGPSTAAPTAAAAVAVAAAPAVAATAADSAVPVAAAPPVVAADDSARQLHGYGQRLSELFSRQQQYPRLAALRGWEGEVRVRLSVARQGSLTAVRLERSSGYEVLDKHALAMIEEIGRLPPPPAGVDSGDIQVVVPIHYKLRKPA